MAEIPKSDIIELLGNIRKQFAEIQSNQSEYQADELPDVPIVQFNDPLTFCIDGSMLPYLGRGWGKPERTRVWSVDKECDLFLKLPKSSHDLLLTFKGEFFKAGGSAGTPVDLWFNGKLIGNWRGRNVQDLSTLILHNHLPESGKAHLVFRFDNPRSPKSLNISQDGRLLGYSFRTMVIKEIQ